MKLTRKALKKGPLENRKQEFLSGILLRRLDVYFCSEKF